MDTEADPDRSTGPLTLAIDIGGTRLKAGLLDPAGRIVRGPSRTDTPVRATPDAIVDALLALARPLAPFDRISVGFPGVVRREQVLTAPNLGTAEWRNFPLAAALADALGKPVRMLNDAEVQGLGVVSGEGLECVITLGTGMGFALFQDGHPAPHLELSQHPLHKDKTYDQFIGVVAYRKIGRKRWNLRMRRVLDAIETLVGFDTLYIGGGNAKQLALELAPNMRVVGNEAGITGGVRLWSPRLDWMFASGAESRTA
ncbi:ROK family protein [Rhodopila sp.]|uniref:ROK family protein n=1 Tax=Rhodopila sp. TaxID=2480087 RepID=UPI003D13B432